MAEIQQLVHWLTALLGQLVVVMVVVLGLIITLLLHLVVQVEEGVAIQVTQALQPQVVKEILVAMETVHHLIAAVEVEAQAQ
jgi:hypothetical protein